ncbi:MAG TPA: NADH-ubiquinone oxidoreductase-F iron-sulfur binding region domain-containing protein [Acidimicrobiia bacterium]|nr:NADH-ubiquinone oxidoreductase-F iron-sulfur binding region domain-containing protein [Acidimicrobiia bacterium]
MESELLLPSRAVTSVEEYVKRGGGEALGAARARGSEWVLDQLDASGLRGRGGAGFPAGRKWRSVASGGPEVGDRYVVANGAEGEPGTFKDRPLMRSNPYQVIEGLAIAADLVRAREAFIVVKASFEAEIVALERALEQMASAELLCDAPITLIGGPEEYLLGEETAMLEVIEGNDPMPRWLPPYLHGLFATTPQEGWAGGSRQIDEVTGASNPTLASNVETFANVPLILRRGADWYRTIGTADTPGPLLCTVVGDVVRAGYGEVEPGTPLRDVIEELGGGLRPGRRAKVVLSGVSNRVLTADHLDAPVSYEGLAAAGAGLGSAGFIVYDETRSALSIARWVSRFLYVESCGQCRACKYGCGEVTRRLDALAERRGALRDVEVIGERLRGVTDQNRCFVGEEEQRVISSLLVSFPDDFAAELETGAPVDTLPVPKIVDIHDGVAAYDEWVAYKQPDWTYSLPPGTAPPRRQTFAGAPGS